jgi:hypothetical protein
MSPRIPNILDQRILSLSDVDHLTLRNFVQGGTLIVGDPGSGKSSTSFKQIICAMMRAGLGGLLHTTKSEDTANYLAYARECGREADVIVFSEDSGLKFDPLAYEWARTTGRGAGSIESCIDYFSTLLSLGKQTSGGGGAMPSSSSSLRVSRFPSSTSTERFHHSHQRLSSRRTRAGKRRHTPHRSLKAYGNGEAR